MSFHITEDQIKNAGFMGITGLFFIRALTSETTRFFGDVRELKRSRLKAQIVATENRKERKEGK